MNFLKDALLQAYAIILYSVAHDIIIGCILLECHQNAMVY